MLVNFPKVEIITVKNHTIIDLVRLSLTNRRYYLPYITKRSLQRYFVFQFINRVKGSELNLFVEVDMVVYSTVWRPK